MSETSQSQARDDDLRWRAPLGEKARIIQADVEARHIVEGNYVSLVPIPADDGPVDHTTTGETGDMHSSTWTGCYLMAMAFRLGWARTRGTSEDYAAALALGGKTLDGLFILSHVSGVPGLLARKIVYGHGPASEERLGSEHRDEWHQGVGEYRRFRYRGHPSHHNYHHVLRGLAYWHYFLSAQDGDPSEEERRQTGCVREVLREMMDYVYKQHDFTIVTVDGRVSQNVLWGTPEGEPSTQALMATSCLKYAHHVTGDEWFGREYARLVERYGYRQAGYWHPERWQGNYSAPRPATSEADHDDTEHVLGSLWLMSRIEEDAELREFYRNSAASLFQTKMRNKRPILNYLYAAITGDTTEADLDGARETMRLYPSVTLTYPLMNSIRTDIEIERTGGGTFQEGVPLPFNDVPFDNSYDWKASPFHLDGWLAREITALAVSAEDPFVWLLSDIAGSLYQTLNGGESFHVVPFYEASEIRGITFAGNKSRIVFLATERGVLRTETGGYENRWSKVALAPGGAHEVAADPRNPNVVWAITDGGVYRSTDLGARQIGQAWERVSSAMPADARVVYGVRPGDDAVIYAALDGRIYRQRPGAEAWDVCPFDARDYRVRPSFRQVVVAPDDPDMAFFVLDLGAWEETWPVLLRTADGGSTIRSVGRPLDRPHLPTEGSGPDWKAVHRLTVAPETPPVVYAATARGVVRSSDGGLVWEAANAGLRIPYAHRVHAPRELSGRLFVGTPAGLHASADGGRTWSDPILVLNGPGVCRVERGGLGYLAAYWSGRYLGFLTDEEIGRPPEEWDRA